MLLLQTGEVKINMEPLQRCVNGHYFDSGKHTSCPFCGVQDLDIDIQKTMAKRTSPTGGDPGATRPLSGVRPSEENKTMGIFHKKLSTEPVVGWLVAVQGPVKGNDYRIVPEKNFIGRSEAMDISITEDETISRENHAVISYNPKNNGFRLFPGDSKRLVFLNNEEVISPEPLQPYDVIELGESKLLFVPFCSERFQWIEEEGTHK